ncbi:hypothetical protein P7C70_g6989, partial [Phenoliferia sp. Uapishka_3]
MFSTRLMDPAFGARSALLNTNLSISPPSNIKKSLQSQAGKLLLVPTRVISRIHLHPSDPLIVVKPATKKFLLPNQPTASSSTLPAAPFKRTSLRGAVETGIPEAKRRCLDDSWAEGSSSTSGSFDTNVHPRSSAVRPREVAPAVVDSHSRPADKERNCAFGSSTLAVAGKISASASISKPSTSKTLIPGPGPATSAKTALLRQPTLDSSSIPFGVSLFRFLSHISPALIPHYRLFLLSGITEKSQILSLFFLNSAGLKTFVDDLKRRAPLDGTVTSPFLSEDIFVKGLERLKEEMRAEKEVLEHGVRRRFFE